MRQPRLCQRRQYRPALQDRNIQYLADLHASAQYRLSLNIGAFVRRDLYNYFPSGNPLADLGPTNLQTSSISQNRTLTNAGVHADFNYAKGIHNVKAGAQYEQTFLREHDSLGVVDATYNSPCVDVERKLLAGLLRSFGLRRRHVVPES